MDEEETRGGQEGCLGRRVVRRRGGALPRRSRSRGYGVVRSVRFGGMPVLEPPFLLTVFRRRGMKNLTFGLGLVWLLYGAGSAPDWDVNISVLMAGLTYLTADRVLRWVWSSRTLLPALFLAWLSVDGVYWLYWSIVRPEVLDFMRGANFKASLCLYVSCGVIWNLDLFLERLRKWRALKA